MKRMIVILTAVLAVAGSQNNADVPYYPYHQTGEREVWMRSENERDQSWVNIAHRGRRVMPRKIRWLLLLKHLIWERICWNWMSN